MKYEHKTSNWSNRIFKNTCVLLRLSRLKMSLKCTDSMYSHIKKQRNTSAFCRVYSWISSIHPLVGRIFPCFQWVLEPRPTPCPWGFAVSPRESRNIQCIWEPILVVPWKIVALWSQKIHVQRNISNLNKKAAFRWLFWGEFQKNFRYAEYLLAFQIRIINLYKLGAWRIRLCTLHLCIPFCPMSRT